MTIYNFDCYIKFIQNKIDENGGRGYQTQLARATGLHTSYLSMVVHGKAHLSLEQAKSVCEYWGLDFSSTDYFMTLVALQKSGTTALTLYWTTRIKEIRNRVQEQYAFAG